MTGTHILILADDLTGAIECAAKFACAGIDSAVSVERTVRPGGVPADIPCLVLDTETRHLSPDEAARRVYELALAARESGTRLIYKKTDSTLRGSIGAELSALLTVWPAARLVFVPAYPQLGRTVKDGRLYVNGKRLEETEFSRDTLNPATESHIPAVLLAQSRMQVFTLRAEEARCAAAPGVYVCDGEHDEDVLCAVRAALALSETEPTQTCLLAGPASVAAALSSQLQAGRLKWGRSPDLPPLAMRTTPAGVDACPTFRSCLVINGSLHPASLEQMSQAAANGFRVVNWDEFDSLVVLDDWLLANAADSGPGTADRQPCARHRGEWVRAALSRAQIDLLVIFGGDTAYAVLEALGCPPIFPIGEFEPGVPVSRIPREALPPELANRRGDLLLVTKAGGFGAPDLLLRLREKMTHGDRG